MNEKEYTLDDAYFSFDTNLGFKSILPEDDIMEKSVIKEGFINLKKLPHGPKNKKRKKRQQITEDLPEEVEKDLKIIRMRDALDPKRFYKRNATKGMKNVQIGRVLDSPADFYHSRLPKKQRKNTLVDELLADAKFKKDIKRRYVQIIEQKKHKFSRRHKNLVKKNNIKNKGAKK